MDQETKDFFEKLYGTMQDGFKKVDEQFKKVDEQFKKVDEQFKKVDERFEKMDERLGNLETTTKKIELRIENEVNPKLDALFDGQTQTNERLDRIEREVQKHEDIIVRKVL